MTPGQPIAAHAVGYVNVTVTPDAGGPLPQVIKSTNSLSSFQGLGL